MERSRSGRGEQLCCGWGLLWEGDSTQPLTLGSAGLQGGDSWQICPSPASKANRSLARRVSKCPNRVRMGRRPRRWVTPATGKSLLQD